MGRKIWGKWMAVTLSTVMIFSAIAVRNNGRVSAEEATAQDNVVDINAQNLYSSNGGVFEGWGTSLCWFGNRIGGSEKTSDEAAKFLCDSNEGLGLNIIRFNIGGGDDPTHDHITRTDSKMPGYWGEYDAKTDTFTYDYTKDANQRNVLKKMQEHNSDLTVEAFSNSAPYFMTISGCTSGTAENVMADNLKEDKYDDFAEYMANVIKYYKENYGVAFSSVEPMNENGWSIQRNGQKQEGCTFMRGDSQSKMILAMQEALKNNGLEDIILAGCDESTPAETMTCLSKLSADALNALERIDTHTYGSGSETKLNQKSVALSKNLWMSETDGGDVAGKKPGEMGAALSLANRIGKNLNKLQPSAWIIWQAIGSYCDKNTYEGNKDPDTLNQSELDTNGFWGVAYADMNEEKVVLTKKYYGFGQYTRYIKKGDYMIIANDKNTVSYDKEKKELKIVAVNSTDKETAIRYHLTGFDVKNSAVEVVRTSGDIKDGENWEKIDDASADSTGFEAVLAPNSITTFIVKDTEASLPGMEIPSVTNQPEQTPAATTQPTQTPASSVQQSEGQMEESTPEKVTQVKVARATKNELTITWKKQANSSYKVAYSTSKKKLAKRKDGKGKSVAGTKVVSSANNKITIKKLKKNTIYYVKVCAGRTVDGETVYGKYSTVKKIKTKK